MVLLTPRFALYVGGLTSGLLKVPGKHTGALVAFLTDQPGFAPVRKRSDPTWVPFGNRVHARVTSPSRSLLGHGRAVIALITRPPTCAAGTGAFPRSATIRDSE